MLDFVFIVVRTIDVELEWFLRLDNWQIISLSIDLRKEYGGRNDHEDEEHAPSDIELPGVINSRDVLAGLATALVELVRGILPKLAKVWPRFY